MENLEEKAIDSVRDYLIDLLMKKDWCRAERIGNALSILINGRNVPIAENECVQAEPRATRLR